MKTKRVIKMHVIYDWITPTVKLQVKRVVLSCVSCFPDITTVSAARAETWANRAGAWCRQSGSWLPKGSRAGRGRRQRGPSQPCQGQHRHWDLNQGWNCILSAACPADASLAGWCKWQKRSTKHKRAHKQFWKLIQTPANTCFLR